MTEQDELLARCLAAHEADWPEGLKMYVRTRRDGRTMLEESARTAGGLRWREVMLEETRMYVLDWADPP